MKPESKIFSTMVGDKTVTMETGRLAGQAGGAVQVRIGDTVVFAAATMGDIRQGIDFFPLTVDYEERMYAGGRIPGSFFRREGRPSEDAILIARLTDRPIALGALKDAGIIAVFTPGTPVEKIIAAFRTACETQEAARS